MLFGRRKPGYTTTVDGSVDPEQAVLELQKAELFAKVRSGQVRVLMGSTFKRQNWPPRKSPRQRCSTSTPQARLPAA